MNTMNIARIKNLFERACRGEELTIGFLGGSITQGSITTQHEFTYTYRVYTWWRDTFPQAHFNYVNGGIGGTDSYYGVSRAVTDVLMYQPDLVIVDFSVNDIDNKMARETYEGVMRKLLSWKSAPGVIALNNVYYDTGITAEDIHKEVADHYGIPGVSIKNTIYGRMNAGEYEQADITPDGLHPNDRGHGLVADEIINLLQSIRENAFYDTVEAVNAEGGGNQDDSGNYTLPEPITSNAYENACRLTIREVCPDLHGFKADTREKMGHLDHFKNGWIGEKEGDSITFEVEGSCIGIQYRKTIDRPAARAQAVIDGDTEHPVLLDGNFDEDWGDCLYIEPVLHHGTNNRHTVEITILPADKDCVTPFYLMSLIVS